MNGSNNQLSRREMLRLFGVGALSLAAGAVTGPDLGLGARPALAQVRRKPIAFFTFKVGDLELTVIRDAADTLDAGILGTNAPAGGIAQTLDDYNLPGSALDLTYNVILMRAGERLALIDTGNGSTTGRLLSTLQMLEVGPETITDVIISHMHPDHIGGAVSSGKLNFPKAMYHYPEAEKAVIDKMPSGGMASANNAIFKIAGDLGQLSLYKADEEVIPGMLAVAAPGHTPGHTAFALESKGKALLVTADTAIHSVISLAHPEWYASFDTDGPTASETRKRIFGDAAAKGTRVLAYHFAFPGTGFIDTEGDGFRFVAAT